MRRSPDVGLATGAALIVLALSPVIVTPSLGTVVGIAGIVLLIAFLVVVFRGAWHGDETRQRGLDPMRRERRDEWTAKRK
jgi:O-antigen ligase